MILTARRAVTAFAAPGPGFPPNYLGMLGPWTGHVSKVMLSGPRLEPQGPLFLPAGH